MSMHMDKTVNRSTMDASIQHQNVGRRRKIVAPHIPKEIPSSLDEAIEEQRIPTTDELFQECRALLGVHLISLRRADDSTKAIASILQAVKAVAQITQIDVLNKINERTLNNMSDNDLQEYAGKLLERLKN